VTINLCELLVLVCYENSKLAVGIQTKMYYRQPAQRVEMFLTSVFGPAPFSAFTTQLTAV